MRPHCSKEFAAIGASELGARAPPTSVAHRLQMPRPNADFDATSATSEPVVRPAARESIAPRASAPTRRRVRQLKHTGRKGHVPDIVHKLSLNRGKLPSQWNGVSVRPSVRPD